MAATFQVTTLRPTKSYCIQKNHLASLEAELGHEMLHVYENDKILKTGRSVGEAFLYKRAKNDRNRSVKCML